MGVEVVGAGGILGPSGRSGRPKLAAGQLESDGDVVGGAADLAGKVLVVAHKAPIAHNEHELSRDVDLLLLLGPGAGGNRRFFLKDGQLLVEMAGRAFLPILEQKRSNSFIVVSSGYRESDVRV